MAVKTLTSKPIPSGTELAEVLRKEFPPTYTCKLTGLGSDKNLLIRKSAMVGVEISIRGNELMVERVHPKGVFFVFLLALGLGETILLLAETFYGVLHLTASPWKKLEREVALVLKRKYY